MTPEIIKQLQDALAPLISKLGQGGDWLLTQAVRMNYAYGIGDLVVAAFCLIAILVVIAFFKAYWKQIVEETQGEGAVALFVLIPLILVMLGAILGAIPRFVAPQYSALQDIIHTVKN